MAKSSHPQGASVDPAEVEKFAAIADEWWDLTGKFRPLHKLNPVRIGFVRAEALRIFGGDEKSRRPLEGRSLLDIGCGGGLMTEPMARLGARVTGIDASERAIAVAAGHAREGGLSITYEATTAEQLADAGRAFDVVLALEIVEHVPDIRAFLGACAALVRPGGLLVISTINRTVKAFALAILGAERVLRWLPEGSHRYDRLVTPGEIRDALLPHGVAVHPPVGLTYDLFADAWRLGTDVSVNYIISGRKRA